MNEASANSRAADSSAERLLHRLLRRVIEVRPAEVSALGWSWLYIFAILSSYYILRPIRDQMGVAGGVDNLQWLFLGTLAAMLFLNVPFWYLVKILPRARFIAITYRFFAANILLFAVALYWADAQQIVWVGRVFFIWVSVFNLFIVSVFWQLMVDIFSSEDGKRLFGFIAAGATLGAIVGSATTASLARHVPTAYLLIGAALLLEIAFGLIDGFFADLANSKPFPDFDTAVEEKKGIPPGNGLFAFTESQRGAGQEQFLQVEPLRHRPLRIVGMDNRQRDYDSARPGRHLVQEIAEQRNFRGHRRNVLARIKIEQAEVDLDVAVGSLNSAQGENALPGAGQPGIVVGDARQLQREVGLHGGADIGRPLHIDIEAAVGELPSEDRLGGFIDQLPGGWVPDAALADSFPRGRRIACHACPTPGRVHPEL